MELKVGDRVEIIVSDICHNASVGTILTVKEIRKDCRVYFDNDGFCFTNNHTEHYKLVEKNMDNLKIGDVLIDDEDDEMTVVAVLDEVVALTYNNDIYWRTISNDIYWRTISGIKNNYSLKIDKEAELIELTIDEIAEKFGKKASEIRIKKED